MIDSLQIASGTGGALDLNAGNLTITKNNLEMTGSGNYTIQDGTLSAGNSSMSLVVIQAGTGTLNLNSVIGGGAAGFVKLGNGTAVMGASNTYTGATVLGGGILNRHRRQRRPIRPLGWQWYDSVPRAARCNTPPQTSTTIRAALATDQPGVQRRYQ